MNCFLQKAEKKKTDLDIKKEMWTLPNFY